MWKENQFDGFNRNGILAICVHKPNVSINMLFCINWHGKEKEIAIIIIILPYDNPTVIVGYDGQFERSKKGTIVTYLSNASLPANKLPLAIQINFESGVYDC